MSLLRCLSILFFCAGVLRAGANSDIAALVGEWRGQSICVTEAPACRNEDVIYYIREIPGRSDSVSIQADKLVDGKAITMGSGSWRYHPAEHTLEFSSQERIWLLKVAGNRIDGTLTLADKSIFRRMILNKSKTSPPRDR